MALENRSSGRFWSRLHFLVRFTGLTGLVVALAGLMIVLVDFALSLEIFRVIWDQLQALLQGHESEEAPRVSILLLLGGLVAGLFALVIELLVMLRVVAGRRSAFGFNAAVQIALATILVVGANLFAFLHYERLDLTGKFVLPTGDEEADRIHRAWTGKFTLPTDLQEDLAKLQGETTIVVCQREKTFGRLSTKPDAYDYAANRKVVEKVKDLVDQFREFGPQFRVEVLDVEAEDYGTQFNQLTKRLAEAAVQAGGESGAEAVEHKTAEFRRLFRRVPENTIFFVSGDQVQHLAFSEFYQLDKVASRNEAGAKERTGGADEGERKGEKDAEDENEPGSNLRLLYQGPGPFAHKALNIDQKRPRVAIATIHELLSTEGLGEIGHHGLKRCLQENGFEVRDILLKKEGPFDLVPAVYTYDESRYETLEEQISTIDAQLKVLDRALGQYRKVVKRWQTESLEELTRDVADQLGNQKLTERMRQDQVSYFKQVVAAIQRQINASREERELAVKEKSGLNVDRLHEQRRLQDLKAKLDRELADVDLLILPRTTFLNIATGRRIGNQYHTLDKAQVEAVRDFLKAGKPVLACFGPINEQGQGRNAAATAKPDEMEDLFTELGVRFGKSVVLFNVESRSFAAQRSGLRAAGLNIDVPPVNFDWKKLWLPGTLGQAGAEPPNPLRRAMQIAQHSVIGGLDLQPRHPRPMGVDPELRKKLAFAPEIMVTSEESWNESDPFPTAERQPHFEGPKENDPQANTLDAARQGPFAIGVALETTVPASWYSEESSAKPATVRAVAFGDGTILVGRELSPARERLVLDSCNWLLGRDDALPRDDRPWSFPRVEMTPQAKKLWMLGAVFGLPGLFAYLGVVVLLVRRLR